MTPGMDCADDYGVDVAKLNTVSGLGVRSSHLAPSASTALAHPGVVDAGDGVRNWRSPISSAL